MRSQKLTLSISLILVAVAMLAAASLACALPSNRVEIVFTADRTSLVAGECTTLRWHIPDEQNVVLNGQFVNPSGQMDVCPMEATTYQLSVGTGDDTRQQEITIVVEEESTSTPPADPATSPTVDQAPATDGPEPAPPPTDTPTEPPPPPPPPTHTPTEPPPTDTPTEPPPPLSFTFSPTSGPVGSDVELYLSAAEQVEIYYEGRVLPKRVLAGGTTLRVTIPGDASSGYFELRWDGQSVRATQQFVVTPVAGALTLYNDSGQTVWYVYISPSTQSNWGDDWLGPDVVASGSSYAFSVPPGQYDLKAEDADQNEIDVRWSVNLSGSYSWRIGP